MGFSRWEYWSGLPFPSSGDPPDPEIEPAFPVSPALAGGFFTTDPPRKPSSQEDTPIGPLGGYFEDQKEETGWKHVWQYGMGRWTGRIKGTHHNQRASLLIFCLNTGHAKYLYRAHLAQPSNLWSLLKERTVLLGVLKALLWDTSLFFAKKFELICYFWLFYVFVAVTGFL